MHSEESIAEALWYKYPHAEYRVPNIYVYGWESDFWVQAKSGYTYEIEIKISKSDFLNDFKHKTKKHEILSTGWCSDPRFDEPIKRRRPNKFFYCVPEGLVDVSDVPDYAGLMLFNKNGKILTVKDAPLLHKEKFNFETELCKKFYYYWWEAVRESRIQNNEIKYLKNLNNQLKQQLNETKISTGPR